MEMKVRSETWMNEVSWLVDFSESLMLSTQTLVWQEHTLQRQNPINKLPAEQTH